MKRILSLFVILLWIVPSKVALARDDHANKNSHPPQAQSTPAPTPSPDPTQIPSPTPAEISSNPSSTSRVDPTSTPEPSPSSYPAAAPIDNNPSSSDNHPSDRNLASNNNQHPDPVPSAQPDNPNPTVNPTPSSTTAPQPITALISAFKPGSLGFTPTTQSVSDKANNEVNKLVIPTLAFLTNTKLEDFYKDGKLPTHTTEALDLFSLGSIGSGLALLKGKVLMGVWSKRRSLKTSFI